ncbi:GNAT family N-acetyltransferase [Rivibacter subsaxonicus]|uniref:RimJ/RimL family protein N-acetyltransferase n=1 Tax=Rivibacter subsaxonicus TaxID=457575 RepID=A0A4Q7W221_9BURK|nr:GNAT family protein [Rivibacter subsaxonicus]RZU02609.1 RimJ/RimL family protein N-acetyltransferase [Rivibacter subsaxonicus]
MPDENAVVYDRQAVLRDGTPVHVRAARADDDRRVIAAFGKLERESVYTRFFSFKEQLAAADLERLHGGDGRRGAAIVVTLAADEDTVIAGASYAVHPGPDGLASAEVAFMTEEDYQGQGLARLLLDALAGIARTHGIARLDAEVLAGNRAMLRVFERSGLPMRSSREDGVVHVDLDLRPAPAGHAVDAPAPR